MIRKIKQWLLVRKINKALDIKLKKWQIHYIFGWRPFSMHYSGSRNEGKTLAQILYLLFNNGYSCGRTIIGTFSINRQGVSEMQKDVMYDLFGEDAESLKKQEIFINRFICVKSQLDAWKIKTNDISVKENYGS